jgi:hypothetical protein
MVGSSWNTIGPKAGFGRKRAAKVALAGWDAPTDALDSTITSASPVGTSAVGVEEDVPWRALQ